MRSEKVIEFCALQLLEDSAIFFRANYINVFFESVAGGILFMESHFAGNVRFFSGCSTPGVATPFELQVVLVNAAPSDTRNNAAMPVTRTGRVCWT